MHYRAIPVAVLFWFSASWQSVAPGAAIEGRVYLDANRNGQADADEPGVEHVLVSDGRRVVATDSTGNYRLEAAESPALVWVSVPRDHATAGPFWRRADGTGREDFGLVSRPTRPRRPHWNSRSRSSGWQGSTG